MWTPRLEQDRQGGRAPSNLMPEGACASQTSPSQPTAGGGLSELKESETKKDTQPHKRCCTFNRNHYQWGVLSGEMSNALTSIRCLGEGTGCLSHRPAGKHTGGGPQNGLRQICTTEWKILQWVCSIGSILFYAGYCFPSFHLSRCSIILELVSLAAQHYLNPNEFLSHNVA